MTDDIIHNRVVRIPLDVSMKMGGPAIQQLVSEVRHQLTTPSSSKQNPSSLVTTPEKIEIVLRRSNLYVHTYAALNHPVYGQVLVPLMQTMYGRSKYMPHMGLKERIKALKSVGVKVPVDVLLQGDDDVA